MKQTQKRKMLSVLMVLLALTVVVPQAVMAATSSGVDIENKATVNYKVGGSSQTPIESNTTSFKVDNRVNPTITADDSSSVTIYPATQKALKFTFTNNGNTTQDFKLSAIVNGTNTFTAAPPGIKFYKDDNPANGAWGGSDTAYPLDGSDYYIDELAKETAVTVFLVVNAPNGATTNQVATYALKGITHASGSGLGAVVANTAGADTPGAVDVVFADGDGDGGGSDDANNDGAYATWTKLGGKFIVSAANITITKTSAIISDPVYGTGSYRKAIPGAVIEYTITVSNGSGGEQATEITVTDTVDSNTTFGVNSYDTSKGIQVTAPNINSGNPLNLTNADDGDEDGASGTQAGKYVSGAVTVEGIVLNADESATIKFRVAIN